MCVTINWPGAVPNSQEQGRGRGKREFSLLPESESFLILSSPNSQEQGRRRGEGVKVPESRCSTKWVCVDHCLYTERQREVFFIFSSLFFQTVKGWEERGRGSQSSRCSTNNGFASIAQCVMLD